jgi:hypothetical protein
MNYLSMKTWLPVKTVPIIHINQGLFLIEVCTLASNVTSLFSGYSHCPFMIKTQWMVYVWRRDAAVTCEDYAFSLTFDPIFTCVDWCVLTAYAFCLSHIFFYLTRLVAFGDDTDSARLGTLNSSTMLLTMHTVLYNCENVILLETLTQLWLQGAIFP